MPALEAVGADDGTQWWCGWESLTKRFGRVLALDRLTLENAAARADPRTGSALVARDRLHRGDHPG